MNYQKIYDNLITKYGAWEKPDGVYTERHRKLPGCLDGKYVKGNAFYLPARVHMLLHLILIKIHPFDRKILHAAFRMSNSWTYGTKEYMWVKEKWASGMVGKGNHRYGHPVSKETKEKISIGNMNKVISKEHRLKISKANSGENHPYFGKVGARIGMKNTIEHNLRLSEFQKKNIYKCAECVFIGNAGNVAKHQTRTGHQGKERK